jgi:hypothetical protein
MVESALASPAAARPQAEPLAEIGQDGGVLGQRLAVVEAQRRHPSERMDLEIGPVRRPLARSTCLGSYFAALFQHDMRGHRARTGRVV